jgi:hypothetical protein
VQRLPAAVGEHEKVRGSKIEVIFVHFDAETSRHAPDVSEIARLFQAEGRRGDGWVVVQSDFNDRSSRQEAHTAPEPGYFTAENAEFTEFGVFFDEDLSFLCVLRASAVSSLPVGFHETEPLPTDETVLT